MSRPVQKIIFFIKYLQVYLQCVIILIKYFLLSEEGKKE